MGSDPKTEALHYYFPEAAARLACADSLENRAKYDAMIGRMRGVAARSYARAGLDRPLRATDEPRTRAGRALLDWSDGPSDYHSSYCEALIGKDCTCDLPGAICAVEEEAVCSLASVLDESDPPGQMSPARWERVARFMCWCFGAIAAFAAGFLIVLLVLDAIGGKG